MPDKIVFDYMLGALRTDNGLTARMEGVEDATYLVEIFEEVSSTTGTLTLPTGATISLDAHGGDIDATCRVITTTGQKPLEQFATDSSGNIITVALSGAGNADYTLSGLPTGSQYAVCFVIEISEINLRTVNKDVILQSEYVQAASDLNLDTTSDTQVLFDDNGVISGIASFVINKATKLLSVFGLITPTIYGGTGSGDTLSLYGSSDPTKGIINLGSNVTVSDAGDVGVGNDVNISNDLNMSAGSFVVLPATTVTDSDISFYNPASVNKFSLLSAYPMISGADSGVAMAVIPKGAGFNASIKSQFSVFNTDLVSDSTNYEALVLRAAGTKYSINAVKSGTGSTLPIEFQMQNQTKLTIYTDGNIGVGITVPTAYINVAAGTATAGTGPLKFTSGTLLSTPEAGVVEFVSDKFYLTDTSGPTRSEIKVVDKYYGEMYQYENATATTVSTQNVYHSVGNFSQNLLSNFTFTSGLEGTGTVTDYSATVAGTVLLTDATHGLTTGDYVTVHNSTDYNGVFQVTVVDANTFYFTDTYTSDQSADWAMGDYLEVDTGADGDYDTIWSVTAFAATANTRIKFELYKNTTPLDNTANSRVYSTASDYGPTPGGGLVALVAGDRIWLALRNESNTQDVTVRHANVRVKRL